MTRHLEILARAISTDHAALMLLRESTFGCFQMCADEHPEWILSRWQYWETLSEIQSELDCWSQTYKQEACFI